MGPQTLRANSPSQLCVVAAHRMWIQPAYYQYIPDCVNLMSGSWHGDTRLRVVSSVQLAQGSCGHCPTVCAVHLSAQLCSMRSDGFASERGQNWHCSCCPCWHNTWSPRGRRCLFFYNNLPTLSAAWTCLVAWVRIWTCGARIVICIAAVQLRHSQKLDFKVLT